MVKCEIRFHNNPHGVYYSGHRVTGKVEITLLKKKNIDAIILNISGRAKTKLNEYNPSEEKHDLHIGREQYLDTNTFLVGFPGSKTITLEPGIHIFNFACDLPLGLPSSFEGKHGFVRYLAKVTLQRPWKFNQEYVAGFTVLKEVDLNLEEPDKRIPFKISTTKQLRSGIFNKKPFSFVMRLPHMGFVPGQIIPISINMQNESSTNLENLQINFNQIVTFRAQFKLKKQCFKSQKVKIDRLWVKNYGRILGESNKTILCDILVPPVPPTSKNSCSIISIDYVINVNVYYGFFQSKIKVECPIIIGTVPLFSAEGRILETSRNSNIAENPSRISLFPHGSSELEPPSYEDAVQMDRVTLTDEIEEPKFLPRYPVYTFDNKRREEFETHN